MQNHIQIPPTEYVLWQGKPDFRASTLGGIFNQLFPFALIWLLFDSFMIRRAPADSITFAFYAIHLFPVWLYLYWAIAAVIRAKHALYIITNKAVYFQFGLRTIKTSREALFEVKQAKIRIGWINKIFGVGDVVCTTCVNDSYSISKIPDYTQVQQMLTELCKKEYAGCDSGFSSTQN